MIVQVAGRAGRAEQPGRVIIQSQLADHPLLVQLTEQGYFAFAEQALTERRATGLPPLDRKSTRLNSSHVKISYAVFCLKQKNDKQGKQNERPQLTCCGLPASTLLPRLLASATPTPDIYTLSLHDALPISEQPGRVIIQSQLADHPLLVQLTEQGYFAFAEQALTERRATGLPPFSHLALLRAESHRPGQAEGLDRKSNV